MPCKLLYFVLQSEFYFLNLKLEKKERKFLVLLSVGNKCQERDAEKEVLRFGKILTRSIFDKL